MPSRRRQVRHQDKKVKKVASDYGDRLFDKLSIHSVTWIRRTATLMPRDEPGRAANKKTHLVLIALKG
jgi:hypothetical protein